jgi:transposase-like protein
MPRSKPTYPPEFKQQMVELDRSGRSVDSLAREFEPSSRTIRAWVKQAMNLESDELGGGAPCPGGLLPRIVSAAPAGSG